MRQDCDNTVKPCNGAKLPVLSLCWLALIVFLYGAAPSVAENTEVDVSYQLNIASGKLLYSLNTLAKQTQSDFIFSYDLVVDKISFPVKGRYRLIDALELMLKDTDLACSLSYNGTIKIYAYEGIGSHNKAKSTMNKTSTILLSALGSISVNAEQTYQQSAGIEEIIVTAQKRSESVQDVPIAINALAGDQLDKMGVYNSDDLSRLFPNLSLKTATSINSGFSIRGVGTENFHVTAQQAVGQYMDEVSLVSPFTGQFGLFDMERVEVLRGPQNTLFGRNTTGGAVNFISRKPNVDDDINGYSRLSYGNQASQDFEAAMGLSLSDSLAVRVAIQTVNRDGVFFNLVDNKKTGRIERHSGRLQLLWQGAGNTQLLANYHFGINRSDRGPRKALGYWQSDSENIASAGSRGPADCKLLASHSVEAAFGSENDCVAAINSTIVNPSTGSWNTVRDAANSIADVDFNGGFVKINHEFESVSLTSITSYDVIEVKFLENVSSTGVLGFYAGQDAEYKVFSQEFRLASVAERGLRWIAGAYYSNESDNLATVIRNGSDGTPPFTVVPSVAIEQEVNVYSLYGQAEFDLSDDLTLTFGLRYTLDEKQGLSTTRVIAGTTDGRPGVRQQPDYFYDLEFLQRATDFDGIGRCPPSAGGLPCKLGPIPIAQKLEEIGGKIGLDYQVSEELLGYVSYSRGFKSGAFDTRALAAFYGNADKPTKPEFLDAYELGFKSNLLDSQLELNGAVFYYLWQDLQTFDVDLNGNPAYVNVPESVLYGAELDLKWAPGGGWFVQTGVGLLRTEVRDAGVLINVKLGAAINDSPELTWSGLIQKEIPLKAANLDLQLDFSYTAEVQDGLADNPKAIYESTLYINARASLNFGESEQYELALWGRNLTGQKACLGGYGDNGSLANAKTCLLNPGVRFYGLSASYHF